MAISSSAKSRSFYDEEEEDPPVTVSDQLTSGYDSGKGTGTSDPVVDDGLSDPMDVTKGDTSVKTEAVRDANDTSFMDSQRTANELDDTVAQILQGKTAGSLSDGMTGDRSAPTTDLGDVDWAWRFGSDETTGGRYDDLTAGSKGAAEAGMLDDESGGRYDDLTGGVKNAGEAGKTPTGTAQPGGEFLDPDAEAFMRSLFGGIDTQAQEQFAREQNMAALGRAKSDLEARGGMGGLGLMGGQIAMGADLQKQAADALTDQILGIQRDARGEELKRGTVASEFLDRGIGRRIESEQVAADDKFTTAILGALGFTFDENGNLVSTGGGGGGGGEGSGDWVQDEVANQQEGADRMVEDYQDVVLPDSATNEVGTDFGTPEIVPQLEAAGYQRVDTVTGEDGQTYDRYRLNNHWVWIPRS